MKTIFKFRFKNKIALFSFLLKVTSIIFLILCLFIPFGPAIKLVSGSTIKVFRPCYSFIFKGYISCNNANHLSSTSSWLGLIGFILILISLISLCLSIFIRKSKILKRTLYVIALLSTLIFSISFLCIHRDFAEVLTYALIQEHSEIIAKTIYQNSTLMFGTYGVSIFGFFSIGFIGLSLFLDLLSHN